MMKNPAQIETIGKPGPAAVLFGHQLPCFVVQDPRARLFNQRGNRLQAR